jgi:cytochrome c peroxidase
MKQIHLDGHDRTDLIQFLQSLSGEVPPNLGPPQ